MTFEEYKKSKENGTLIKDATTNKVTTKTIAPTNTEQQTTNPQTTAERIQSKIDKLWVDKTSTKPTATSQLGTSLVQQVKNGTTQRQNKSNVLGKAANNIVKTITEKVPVTSKYVQAYQKQEIWQ